MRRITIIGSSGAGKSVFARQLGKILGIEVSHLDNLYWKPNWTRTPRREWELIQKELIQNECWIIDGNYQSTLELRLSVADTIIFFDFPKWRCLWRALRRRVKYHNKTRPDLGGDNTEHFTIEFLHWILTYPRKETIEKIQKYSKANEVITFRKPAEVNDFLHELVQSKAHT